LYIAGQKKVTTEEWDDEGGYHVKTITSWTDEEGNEKMTVGIRTERLVIGEESTDEEQGKTWGRDL